MFIDRPCLDSLAVEEQRCPDFYDYLAAKHPGITEPPHLGYGLTDGNNKGSSTGVFCDSNNYFNGNDRRYDTGVQDYKVKCRCNACDGCRWVWKDNAIRQCLPKDQCVGLDRGINWGGHVASRIVGDNGVHLHAQFYQSYHSSMYDNVVENGWTVVLVIPHQVISSIGNWELSASSLEADLIGVHQESDCSSTVFQFQSNDFYGHSIFRTDPFHKAQVNALSRYINF